MRALLLCPLAVLAVTGTALASDRATTPKVAAMDHMAIYVSDLNRSVDFYTRAFGFKEAPAPVPFARWLVMANGVTLHLVQGRKEPVNNPKWDHLALAGGPIEETIAHFDAQHIAWTDINGQPRPQVRPDGVKQIFVSDPDGYWVEINDKLARQ